MAASRLAFSLEAHGGLGFTTIVIMENQMETTIVYWGYNGIMEKKMETTGILGVMVGIQGLRV